MTTPQQQDANNAQQIARVINKPDASGPSLQLVKAVVGAVHLTANPPAIDVNFSGSSTTVTGVAFLDTYSPVVNDVIMVLQQGTEVVALGHIKDTNNGTSQNGWQTPTLNTGYTTNGNSNGPLMYRIIIDNGDLKLQFKGSVGVGGGVGTVVFTLPAGYRPASKATVNVARDLNGTSVCLLDINTNGDVGMIATGTFTLPATTTSASSASNTGTFDVQHYHIDGDGSTHTSGIVSSGNVGGQTDGGANPHSHTMAHTHTVTVTIPTPTFLVFSNLEIFLN